MGGVIPCPPLLDIHRHRLFGRADAHRELAAAAIISNPFAAKILEPEGHREWLVERSAEVAPKLIGSDHRFSFLRVREICNQLHKPLGRVVD